MRKQPLTATPLRDVQQEGADRFVVTGPSPLLELRAARIPGGWLEVDFACDVEADVSLPARLVWEGGDVALPPAKHGRIRTITRVPPAPRTLQFSPGSHRGVFRFGEATLRAMSRVEAGARIAVPIGVDLLGHPARLRRAALKVVRTTLAGGPLALRHAFLRRAGATIGDVYPEWHAHYAQLTKRDVRQIRARIAEMPWKPRITVQGTCGGLDAQLYREFTHEPGGDYTVFVDGGDSLPPEALFLIADAAVKNPGVDLIYTDEDRVDGTEPHFKPDWNPELLASWNYVGRLAAFRAPKPGLSEHALARSARTAVHVPRIGYHAATGPRSDAPVKREPLTKKPLVSLIIPTRDARAYVEQCIRSVQKHTAYAPYEIILIDNQSRDPAALALFAQLASEGVRVLKHDAPFNYAAINNRAVREARGEIVVLLNNDVEAIEPGWLDELVSHAVNPEVGAVGAKLLYADGRIQHAGVLVGLGGVAGHIFRLRGRHEEAYFKRPQVTQAIGAVTAACLAVRKQAYLDVGGLDEEHLHVAFNDVDFCLKLAEHGLRNVYTPHAELIHHESVSRGKDDTPAKRARFDAEYDFMVRKWGDVLQRDPAHNPNLSLDSFEMQLAFPPRVRPPWR